MSTTFRGDFDPGRYLAGFAAAERFRGQRNLRLHLGPGPIRIPDWIRISPDPTAADLDLDLRLALPFEDGSVDRIYAWQVPDLLGTALVAFAIEAARILSPGGRLRLVGRDRAPLAAEVERLALQGVVDLDRIRTLPVWAGRAVVALLTETGFSSVSPQPIDGSEAADLAGLESLHGLALDDADRWFVVEGVR